MNNEEKKEKAITFFKSHIDYLKQMLESAPVRSLTAIACQNELDHIEIAIEALEQKSETSTFDEIKAKMADLAYKDPSEDYEYGYNDGLQRAINELSSVAPQSKTGKWIEKDYFFEHGSAKCSCCGKRDHVIGQDTYHGGYNFTFHDYCPNCGAKMRSLNNE